MILFILSLIISFVDSNYAGKDDRLPAAPGDSFLLVHQHPWQYYKTHAGVCGLVKEVFRNCENKILLLPEPA